VTREARQSAIIAIAIPWLLVILLFVFPLVRKFLDR